MKQHAADPKAGFPLFSEAVADFVAIQRIPLPSAHTILFIAVDAGAIQTEVISAVAASLLASGLIAVCVWGPDCQRVHDIFDEVNCGNSSVDPEFVFMTTWHADEPLEKALWYFIYVAFPPDAEFATTSYIAVTVGNADWAVVVEEALSDVPRFASRIVSDESEAD